MTQWFWVMIMLRHLLRTLMLVTSSGLSGLVSSGSTAALVTLLLAVLSRPPWLLLPVEKEICQWQNGMLAEKHKKPSFKAQYVCLFSPSHLSFLDLKRWNHQCLISVLLCKYSHLKGPTGFVWRQWLTQTRASSAASCWQCPSAASPSASWGPRAAAPGSWTSCQCQLLWIWKRKRGKKFINNNLW